MFALGCIYRVRKEYEQVVAWFTKAAEKGPPEAKYNLACCLDQGKGVAAPDYPAAADWYRRAADAGSGEAANNLSNMYAVGRGRARKVVSATFVPRFLSWMATRDA
jgi:TPR repeat protein